MIKNNVIKLQFLLIISLYGFSHYVAAAEDQITDPCGKELYKEKIALTKNKITKPSFARLPFSPHRPSIRKGCVGISFSINTVGLVFNAKIKKTSHVRVFNRSALYTIKKYRFQQNDKVFKEAYLIINFDYDYDRTKDENSLHRRLQYL